MNEIQKIQYRELMKHGHVHAICWFIFIFLAFTISKTKGGFAIFFLAYIIFYFGIKYGQFSIDNNPNKKFKLV